MRGQDGWILANCFFGVFMDRDGVEVHNLSKKKGQYPAILTEQARSLSNGPYKKDSATRQGMQKGANFCTTLLLLYHTSDWLNE